MGKSGRKPVLDEVKRGQVCALLTAGQSLRAAARYVGCSHNTIRNTARREPEFAQQLRRARAECELLCLKKIQAAGDRSWRAAAWTLERLWPERYEKINLRPRAAGPSEAARSSSRSDAPRKNATSDALRHSRAEPSPPRDNDVERRSRLSHPERGNEAQSTEHRRLSTCGLRPPVASDVRPQPQSGGRLAAAVAALLLIALAAFLARAGQNLLLSQETTPPAALSIVDQYPLAIPADWSTTAPSPFAPPRGVLLRSESRRYLLRSDVASIVDQYLPCIPRRLVNNGLVTCHGPAHGRPVQERDFVP